jgi:hypothetical protein
MTATAREEVRDSATEVTEPSGARRSRRPLIAIAALVVIVAAGGLLLIMGRRSAAPAAVPPAAPLAVQPSGQRSDAAGGATTRRAGSVGQAVVPVSSYFTGPDPFVPKIQQASGPSAGGSPTGG